MLKMIQGKNAWSFPQATSNDDLVVATGLNNLDLSFEK